MLNIPESVKALYKLDSCRKNFRCHFPNGELPDVTNENIVQESVHFCESISSRDVLKFGLTEASSIEFETVGVANMYGMTIECSSEIDCSSLTTAEVDEIEAGEWDGEYVSLADSDLGYAYFRVPYGTFRVESCPRDHQAMAHRQVTAYSLAGGEIDETLEKQKLSLLLPGATYTPDLYLLGLSALYQNMDGGLESEGFTKTEYTPSGLSPLDVQKTLELKDSNGNDVQLIFSAYGQSDSSSTPDSNYILAVDVNTTAINAAIETAIGVLEDYDIDIVASGYASYLDILKAGWVSSTGANLIYPLADFVAWKRKGSTMYTYPITAGLNFTKTTQAFYVYRTLDGGTIGADFSRVTRLTILDAEYTRHDCLSVANGTFYKYTAPTTLPEVKLNFEPTNTEKVSTQSGSFIGNAFDGAFSVTDIVKGFLELKAQFAAPERSGGYRVMRLTDTTPVAVVPGKYSQMWFDEYDVEPIGTVRYSYKDDAGEEQIASYKIGDGASVYDMTDNAVLKIIGATPTEIEAMLDADFVPYLGPVNFVPIDLAMKGLPYIEAGDALTVTAQDGTVCNSYALRRELDGVQVLTDQIDSQSGLIIDSEEGE